MKLKVLILLEQIDILSFQLQFLVFVFEGGMQLAPFTRVPENSLFILVVTLSHTPLSTLIQGVIVHFIPIPIVKSKLLYIFPLSQY